MQERFKIEFVRKKKETLRKKILYVPIQRDVTNLIIKMRYTEKIIRKEKVAALFTTYGKRGRRYKKLN